MGIHQFVKHSSKTSEKNVNTPNSSLPTQKKMEKTLARILELTKQVLFVVLCVVHTDHLEFANSSLLTLLCHVKAGFKPRLNSSAYHLIANAFRHKYSIYLDLLNTVQPNKG